MSSTQDERSPLNVSNKTIQARHQHESDREIGEFVPPSYGGTVELPETTTSGKSGSAQKNTSDEIQPLLGVGSVQALTTSGSSGRGVVRQHGLLDGAITYQTDDDNEVEEDTDMVGFEEGVLYQFTPSDKLQQFYLFRVMDASQRHHATIQEKSLLIVLERRGLYSYISVSGIEGWLYLTTMLLEDRRIFRPIVPRSYPNNNRDNNSSTSSCMDSLYCRVIGKRRDKTNKKPIKMRLSRGYIEPLRYYYKYEDWHGKNAFLLGGRLILDREYTFFCQVLTVMHIAILPFFFRVMPEFPYTSVRKAWVVSIAAVKYHPLS